MVDRKCHFRKFLQRHSLHSNRLLGLKDISTVYPNDLRNNRNIPCPRMKALRCGVGQDSPRAVFGRRGVIPAWRGLALCGRGLALCGGAGPLWRGLALCGGDWPSVERASLVWRGVVPCWRGLALCGWDLSSCRRGWPSCGGGCPSVAGLALGGEG
jgi:hypothetical protein